MSRLNPEQLHVKFMPGIMPEGPIVPRRYTLTHSDVTGNLYLTVGPEYNRRQIAGWYTRLMRDEVLAEWHRDKDGPALHVYCHISGGLIVGSAGWRNTIFQRELPLVLEAFRFGDGRLFESHPELDYAPVWVHFHAVQPVYNRTESWGQLAEYRLGITDREV